MDWMLLKRAVGINNQKDGEDNFHVDVFLKWESGHGNWCDAPRWVQACCLLCRVIVLLFLGAPLSPQVCTVFHTSSVKNAVRRLSVLCCSATTSTVQTSATSENGGGANELSWGQTLALIFSHHVQLSFSTLAFDISIVVLMTLWQKHTLWCISNFTGFVWDHKISQQLLLLSYFRFQSSGSFLPSYWLLFFNKYISQQHLQTPMLGFMFMSFKVKYLLFNQGYPTWSVRLPPPKSIPGPPKGLWGLMIYNTTGSPLTVGSTWNKPWKIIILASYSGNRATLLASRWQH